MFCIWSYLIPFPPTFKIENTKFCPGTLVCGTLFLVIWDEPLPNLFEGSKISICPHVPKGQKNHPEDPRGPWYLICGRGLDGLKSLESAFNCEPESKLVQKVWSEELKSLKGEGFNLFLFQGLCVDDAQGQRRLGIQLLDGSCNVISTPTSQPWSPPQPTLVTTYNTKSGNPEPWIRHRI